MGNKKAPEPFASYEVLDSGVVALRSLWIWMIYSCLHRGHQIGRFSAVVSGATRCSFLLQIGHVIQPFCSVISISENTEKHNLS